MVSTMPQVEKKLFRVEDPYDPNRCQANIANNQCPFLAEPDSQFCQIHIGKAQSNSQPAIDKKARNYRISIWQNRINEFADNPEIKSLREELGIARLLLENILDRCHDKNDLYLHSSKISDLILKIEKIVSSCHRLEQSTGSLLDKTLVLQIANTMIEIIGKHINNTDLLETISDDIINNIIKTSKINALKESF
jgi:hypothetical protein